ncbi:hypothetical protein [Agarivorans sp. JK6]|uniref:hypothetical protein n=1 Tax=Agarivorans sp. JK6 TaxID=2997426 RepID=UPI00387330B5
MHSTTQQLVNLTNIYHTLDCLTQFDQALNRYSPALFGTFQQVLYSQTAMQLEVLQASTSSKQNACLGWIPKNTVYTGQDPEDVWLSKYIKDLPPSTLKTVQEETIVRVYLNRIFDEFSMHTKESMEAKVEIIDLQKLHESIEDLCDRYSFPLDVKPMTKDSISFLLGTLEQLDKG